MEPHALDAEEIKSLLSGVTSQTEVAVIAQLRGLAPRRVEEVEALVEGTRSAHARVALSCVVALSRSRQEPAACQALVALLHHPQAAVRREAARSLSALHAYQDVAAWPLVKAFLHESDPTVLKELARTLNGLSLGPKAIAHLLKFLELARTTPFVTLPLRPPTRASKASEDRAGVLGWIQRLMRTPPPPPPTRGQKTTEICRLEDSSLVDVFGIVADVVQALSACAAQQPEIFESLLQLSRVPIRQWDTSSKVAEALARRSGSVQEQDQVFALLSGWIAQRDPQLVQSPAMSVANAAPAHFAIRILQALLQAGHDLDPNWSALLTGWPSEVVAQIGGLLRSSPDPARLQLLRVSQPVVGRMLAESPSGLEACLASPDPNVVRVTCQTLARSAGCLRDLAPGLLCAWRDWTSRDPQGGGVGVEIESLMSMARVDLPEDVVATLRERPRVALLKPDLLAEVVLEANFSAPFDPQQQPWRGYLAQCHAARGNWSQANGDEALYLLAPPRLYRFHRGQSQDWPLPQPPQNQSYTLLWIGDHGDVLCTFGHYGEVGLCHLEPDEGKWTALTPPLPYEGLAHSPLRRLPGAGRSSYAWTDSRRAYYIDASLGTIREAPVESIVALPEAGRLIALDVGNSVKDWRWDPLSGERYSVSTELRLPRQEENPLLTRVTAAQGQAVGLEAFPGRRLVLYGWNWGEKKKALTQGSPG